MVLPLLLLSLGLARAEVAGTQTQEQEFERARQLIADGKEEDAFLVDLAVPGAEHIAAALALVRGKAARYLEVLRTRGQAVPAPAAKLLEGDLLGALGRKAQALECYRQVVAAHDGYFVEPAPAPGGGPSPEPARSPRFPAFSIGPGSQRDNWLIRRFIALEAWEDAAGEFARIWELHRRRVRPQGFDGLGLQFALDYAYFLKRQGRADRGLEVLLEPVLAIDMDRNPDDAQPAAFRMTNGVSRKEFLRLAYGEFKAVGKSDRLVAALEARIAGGENRSRRVLAQVLLHAGRGGDALALELTYIAAGGFDPLTAAYRRGVLYEGLQKLPQAAEQYEQVLALPYAPPRLPAEDEEVRRRHQMSALVEVEPAADSPAGRVRFLSAVMDRLERIDSALGRPEQALDLVLRQLDLDDDRLRQPIELEKTARRFQDAGRPEKFAAWGKARLDRLEEPLTRANLAWAVGDRDATIQALARAERDQGGLGDWFELWRSRFRSAGKDQFHQLLDALLEANPDDGLARLVRAELDSAQDGPEARRALGRLLELSAVVPERAIAACTRSRNRFDLAYRLMRLHEAAGEPEPLVALGFRVLEGAGPFKRAAWEGVLTTRLANGNSGNYAVTWDILRCVFRMLPYVTRPEDRDRLQALADRSECIPLKNQVARRISGRRAARLDPADEHRRAYRQVTIRTLGLPAGSRILTRRDDVRALAPGARWIGTSWGLVRQRALADDVLEIVQIPLGTRVHAFCATPAGLFCATADELYRLDDPDGAAPALVHIALRSAWPFDMTAMPLRESQLLWFGDALWIKGKYAEHVIRYDPKAREVAVFRDVEGPLFVAAGRLWGAWHVLDEKDGLFKPLSSDEGKLLGASGAEVFCDLRPSQPIGFRLALVDPGALAIRPLPVVGPAEARNLPLTDYEVCGNDSTRVWLVGRRGSLTFIYDRATGAVTRRDDRLIEHEFHERRGVVEFQGPAAWRIENGYLFRYDCGLGRTHVVAGLGPGSGRGPFHCMNEPAGGKRLVGGILPGMWPETQSREVGDLEGGLYEIDSRSLDWQRLDSREDQLTETRVKRIVFDDEQARTYVCTDGGVTILANPEGGPIGRITTMDGLPSNLVEDVARIGAKLYIGCAAVWNQSGGLAVLDLATGLIQVLSTSDGLASDQIKELHAAGTRLHILCGIDREKPAPGGSILDTETGAVSTGGGFAARAGAPARGDGSERPAVPYLGGGVLVDVRHGSTRYIGGPRGLVLVAAGAESGSARPFDVEAVKPAAPRRGLLAESEQRPLRIETPGDLARVLSDPNPYYRARAVASLLPHEAGLARFAVPLGRALDDSEPRVRSTALYFVIRLDDRAAVPLLQARLDDPDGSIRAIAAVALAVRGQTPRLKRLREAFDRPGGFVSAPFGTTGNRLGFIPVSKPEEHRDLEELREQIVRRAPAEAVALVLEYPTWTPEDYAAVPEEFTRLRAHFNRLGEALRQHPEALAIVLKAEDRDQREGHGRFIAAVFRHAGPALLPALHAALASEDRVVRSNAARACGAIGDRRSVPLLIQALDLESGLSRASIVAALGALKAEAALPRLVALYVASRHAEIGRGGSGSLAAQLAAAAQRQYEQIGDLAAIGADLDKLAQGDARRPRVPEPSERVLEPADILAAVRSIGSAAAQDFYCKLAAEADANVRRDAALRLADEPGADRARSVPVLRELLADADQSVRLAAAVSLLNLGRNEGQPAILEALRAPERVTYALYWLQHVKDRARLDFAGRVLESLAHDPNTNETIRHGAAQLVGSQPADPR